jgi:hypothetical protein
MFEDSAADRRTLSPHLSYLYPHRHSLFLIFFVKRCIQTRQQEVNIERIDEVHGNTSKVLLACPSDD